MVSPEYQDLDRRYLAEDKALLLRTRNLRLIPEYPDRRGGKLSYAEWAHVVGIFQTLMFLNLRDKADNVILDVGCGTGLLGIASEPFVTPRGRYIGVDISRPDIDFCRAHYPQATHEFHHLDTSNPVYAPDQDRERKHWEVAAESVDLLSALSLWTHLSRADALFYFGEIDRVLKPGARALVTCFLLDDAYHASLARRSHEPGRYHGTTQDEWIFDRPCDESRNWLSPRWADPPESAIGITTEGVACLLEGTRLTQVASYPGNWKELPGIFFQDVLVLERQAVAEPA